MPTPSRGWRYAALAALAMAVLEAFQNSGFLTQVSWTVLFLLELPVWFTWVALAPGIFLLARRYPLTGQGWLRHLPVHVLASAAACVLLVTVVTVVRAGLVLAMEPWVGPSDRAYLEGASRVSFIAILTIRRYFALLVLIYFAIVVLAHAIRYYAEYSTRLLRQSELETELARAQLEALKLQLQPHFLFNTLHTVSALMTRDVGEARRVIARLSELLRYALRDADGNEVPLHRELEFLRAYLGIQQTRFRDALRVSFSVEGTAEGLLVPRMLLQPLLENAIAHGGRHGREVLHVAVEARVAGAQLVLSVSDDGAGIAAGPVREGIGLGNTRKRLAHLYPGRHELALSYGDGGGFRVTVTIPGRAAAGATPSGDDGAHLIPPGVPGGPGEDPPHAVA